MTLFTRTVRNRRRFVLLDRDGTLNAKRHYLLDPAELVLLPTVVDGLRQLRAAGVGLVVVTNQSPVGRGLLTMTQLSDVHHRLEQLLAVEGITLDGIYACPHHPADGCVCRKPRTGLVRVAAAEHGFDPAESFVIGDSPCDIELGHNINATTVLVSDQERATDGAAKWRPDFVAETFLDAARVVITRLG